MPSKTFTKPENSGIKRKTAPDLKKRIKVVKRAKIHEAHQPVKKEARKDKIKSNSISQRRNKSPDNETSEESDLNEGSTSEGEIDDTVDEGVNSEPLLKADDGLHPERAKVVIQNTQSSKESHAKQKQLAQERKAAKPLADDVARTKKIWERLRRKSHVPVQERKILVKELFQIITGKIKEFVLKHDSVRVVQTAVKYANPDQKQMIAQELVGTYCKLSESKYAKFLIGKLLVHGNDQIRDIIIPEFFGQVRRLINHSEASWILDDIYRGAATKKQKAQILRECYGAEFALFQDQKSQNITAELSEIIKTDPSKRTSIMRSLIEFINQLIQKKMTGFTLLHDAMLQYFLNAKIDTNEFTDFMDLIKGDEEGDLLKNLAFTKSGSRLVCLVLAHGNAKDRKQVLRMYRDTIQMMAADQYGHVVILTAYEVIDDTVFTAKSIFPELLSKDPDKQVENVVYFANNLNARITLLYLYQRRSKALFPSSHSSDLHLLREIEEARKSTSKKDPEIRRAELVKELSSYLLRVIKTAASSLVKTSFGCQFVTEVLFEAHGDKSEALSAVAATAAGDPTLVQLDAEKNKTGGSANDEKKSPHIATSSYGGKMLRSLIAGGRFDPETKSVTPIIPALDFANILYPNIKDHIIKWATGPASFVILALVESSNFSEKQDVLNLLKSEKEKLETASREYLSDGSHNNRIMNVEPAKNGKIVKNREKNLRKGNRGSALLLEVIS